MSSTAPEVCQLHASPSATTAYSRRERWMMSLEKKGLRVVQIMRKIAADPKIVLRKVADRFVDQRSAYPGAAPIAPSTQPKRRTRPLEPGDRVRVKTPEEIAATFDSPGRTEGMGYLNMVMDRYAGGTFTVRGRVDRFFDEKNWRMVKLRNSVILEGVYCQPSKEAGVDFAGCSRSCFLFWKEDWLERIESPSGANANR